MSIRPPTVAGAFYPALQNEITLLIKDYLSKSSPRKINTLKALIVPHAGYSFSGQVASDGYKLLENIDHRKKWKIIILGPSHYTHFKGVSIGNYKNYQTPLGDIPVSSEAKKFLKEDQFKFLEETHPEEHCIEVQLPFLQICLKEFEIIPILIGDANIKTLSKSICRHLDSNTLIIVSTDLSHFHSYHQAREIDKKTIEAVKSIDASMLRKGEACGISALETIIYIAQEKKWNIELISYKNSGDTSGNKNKVVGYASFVFYK